MTNSPEVATASTVALAASEPASVGPSRGSTIEPLEPLEPRRLGAAKRAYTTRFLAEALALEPEGYSLASGPGIVPRPGDIVLARVVEIGKHTKLESPGSRRQTMFVGDEVLVAYGNRYAPDQFEARVPDHLGEAHLVAAGGVISWVTAQHALIDDPTRLMPLGLLHDRGGVVTLERLAPRRLRPVPEPHGPRLPERRPRVVAVLGTSMNSGKSTTAAHLVHGLTRAGMRVSAGKVTGTGAGGDPRLFGDAGAAQVLDFTDFGFASTFRVEHEVIRSLLVSLVEELLEPVPDVVVIEIADGVYQDETARLLADPLFHAVVDCVIFAASDALGAVAGLEVLRSAGVEVVAVSGVVTASPMAAGEAAGMLDAPVIQTVALAEAEVAVGLLP